VRAVGKEEPTLTQFFTELLTLDAKPFPVLQRPATCFQQLDGFVPAFSDLEALACPGLPVSTPCQPLAERPFSTMLNAYAESNRPPGVMLCFQQLDGFVSTFFPMGPGYPTPPGPSPHQRHQPGIRRHGESGVPNPPRHFMLSRVFNKLTALFRIFVLGGRAVPRIGYGVMVRGERHRHATPSRRGSLEGGLPLPQIATDCFQ